MKNFARTAFLVLIIAGCTTIVGDTPTSTGSSATETVTSAPTTTSRECVRVTGGNNPVASGSVAQDALHLSGELFVCADDVVVVGPDDVNEVAVGAQLAAALGGPLLHPNPQLAAELGRLKPMRVHIIGAQEVDPPSGAEVLTYELRDAVDVARLALGVSEQVRLPAVPDASTIVETVRAITDRDRVVLPQAPPSTTQPSPRPSFDEAAIISGLAVPSGAESVWLVDADNPVEILMASANGRTIGASTVAYDSADVLGYPEVSDALAGRPTGAIRFVGTVPNADEWEFQVLISGLQVPGGGFHILPEDSPRRYVAFYGHPETTALGALGEQGPEATLDRMQTFLDAYAADGRAIIPTFEMLASVAAARITDDDYSYEWPIETYDDWIRVAEENDAYVVLDLQPGRDDFLAQAKQYEELLKLPFVGLALDPEWRLKPDQVHLKQVGRVEASEVNLVVDWLADLVRDNGLPQKMLIVHQFRLQMIQNRETLKHRPELQMIIQMDGDGTEPQKDDTYRALTQGTEGAHWSWGWKNFFDEDEPGPPTPESTIGKIPTPVYVSYQ